VLYFQLRSALFSPSVICLFVIFFARRSYRTSIICVVFSIFSYRIAAFRRSSIALVAAMYQKGAFATMSFATCCAALCEVKRTRFWVSAVREGTDKDAPRWH